jgi:DNA-binding NtrC family response regulator
VVVTDQRMPKMTGLELLRAARPVRPDAVGIIVTAFTDVEVLIEAINLGQIYRYITKPWDGKEVRGVLQQAIERTTWCARTAASRSSCASTPATSTARSTPPSTSAPSSATPALREVLAKVEQVAPTASTVLPARRDRHRARSWSRTPSTSTARASRGRSCA